MKLTSDGAFTTFSDRTEIPAHLQIRPGESAVGLYRNPPPWEDTVVLFTSHTLLIASASGSYRVEFADIIGYETPPTKEDVNGVRIRTKDGFRFVRIAGSFGPDGNRKDAYSFIAVVRALLAGNLEGR